MNWNQKPVIRTLGMLLGCAVVACSQLGSTSIRAEETAPRQWAIVREPKLIEGSGIAPALSSSQPAFWILNDGAGILRIYAINSTGQRCGLLEVPDSQTVDTEDLASFSLGNMTFLLAADTGNNDLDRPTARLFLLPEPTLEHDFSSGETAGKQPSDQKFSVKPLLAWDIAYPDAPRNVEALGVDPVQRKILLVSKEKKDAPATVYQTDLPINEQGKLTADWINSATTPRTFEKLGRINVPTVLGMTMNPTGDTAVLLGKSAVTIIRRDKNQTWADAFTRPGIKLDIPRQKKGESICFGPVVAAHNGPQSLFLHSEGTDQPIWEIPWPTIVTPK
ncbi:MAG: hypothetical protein SFX18_12650 [Pirellulales bacterium]|nr:hypothetical protein [Pirellulales bacterium]